jgi:nucleosome binding factor SPN SPT16 subunit
VVDLPEYYQKNISMACKLSTQVIKNFFVEEFQNIIDQGKKVTHEKLATLTESCLTDDKQRAKVKFPKEVALRILSKFWLDCL